MKPFRQPSISTGANCRQLIQYLASPALFFVFLIGLVSSCADGVAQESKEDFRFETVAKIFEARCITCHNSENAKAGFSLSTRTEALAGGEDGPVIEIEDPDESILLEYIQGPNAEMPPKGESLTQEQVDVIRDWIKEGAKWPEGKRLVQAHLRDASWWSFQPLKPTEPPRILVDDPHLKNWPRNEIDQFVLSNLLANQLLPAPEADRRTLIRRLYFDLIGLPPTPEAIESFLADDHPKAYERLVDQLLESERYGERWARHWLDVVHYGDTHGYDKDKLRTHAWPYRDYVIRSLNEDKPWSRFIREQVAGDRLYPNTRDGIEALGFIAAGPWDFVGHAEVSEDKVDGKIARHLDRDDMVRTTIKSFMGLTVGCAQCHDHKFDPISQADYYRLHAVFAALDRADKLYDIEPSIARKRASLNQTLGKNRARLEVLRIAAEAKVANELKEVDAAIQATKEVNSNGELQAFGYHSQIETDPHLAKWVQVDLGEAVSVHEIVMRPCKDDFNGIGEGFGFPRRFQIQLSEFGDFDDAEQVDLVVDRTEGDFDNPQLNRVSFDILQRKARYVRIVATKLAPRSGDYIFALAELEVLDELGANRALNAKVTSQDSIEAPIRWSRNNLTDGKFLEETSKLAELQSQRQNLLMGALTKEQRKEWGELRQQIQSVEKRLAQLPERSRVYAGTVHSGSGTFVGTGARGGQPRPIYRLARGDVRQPAELMSPGAISVLGLQHHFDLGSNHDEADRRAALANWIADTNNQLTWRNVVNRVWQYHFGQGIVGTPDDFGRMGGVPSNPELLDFLAVKFRDQGQSLKSLHRMMVTSATWRQSSSPNTETRQLAQDRDADNRLLWKMPRRKLEAEAIRDSVLSASGKLNLKMYGPGFRDFELKRPEHSPHYEYHLHDPDDESTHRRSIYRFVVRSQLQPFLTSLDCADPSIQVGRRNESLTPLQSLTMLNSGFIVAMSKHFADRLERDNEELRVQVQQAFYRAIGRKPSKSELDSIVEIAEQHGLENACRLIFNLNEFSFVD